MFGLTKPVLGGQGACSTAHTLRGAGTEAGMSDENSKKDGRRGSGAKLSSTTLRLTPGASPAGAGRSRSGQGRSSTWRSEAPGLAARDLALAMLVDVLDRHRPFDDAITAAFASSKGLALDSRDRGLARLIAATVLRRKGIIETVLARFMEKPLAPRYEDARRIMLAGAAQILYLDTPPHAAVSIAVTQCRHTPAIQHLAKLINAVLRRIAMEGRDLRADLGVDEFEVTFPGWLKRALVTTYGEDEARAIAQASLGEAPLDLSIKRADEAEAWAKRLDGVLLATGTVRLPAGGRIEDLEGYAQGAWWVQDAAAALPARLLGDDLVGREVADLCAAPGGKTAQLASRGAKVTAVDISATRLQRVKENMARLGLSAEVVESDVLGWQPQRTFDAILLDAPCSATGTLRRHPDILHIKSQGDIDTLVRLQSRLLDHAAKLVRPGGTLVYCTCSLGKAEGESHIQGFLDRNTAFRRSPVRNGEDGIDESWIAPGGAVRTKPTQTPAGDPEGRGMDGFYMIRLIRGD